MLYVCMSMYIQYVVTDFSVFPAFTQHQDKAEPWQAKETTNLATRPRITAQATNQKTKRPFQA